MVRRGLFRHLTKYFQGHINRINNRKPNIFLCSHIISDVCATESNRHTEVLRTRLLKQRLLIKAIINIYNLPRRILVIKLTCAA